MLARSLIRRCALLTPVSRHVLSPSRKIGLCFFSQTHKSQAPFKVYDNSKFSKALSFIPQPIKTFGSIMFGTALFWILAPGFILFVLPPVLVGSFMLWRRIRQAQSLLYDQRWKDIASYHLFKDGTQRVNEVIPYEIRSRIYDALVDNEQDLGNILGNPSEESIQYTNLESLSQDFRASFGSIAENMVVEQYGMVGPMGDRLATVNLILIKDGNEEKYRIEITPNGSSNTFVLDGGSPNDEVIDVKAHKD